jgi:hypothetical protein
MFRWILTDRFSFFIDHENGQKVPTSEWESFKQDYLAQFSILYELIDNGFAEIRDYECDVEIAEVLNISDIDKQILDLPSNYPFDIYIQSVGQLNQNSFEFNLGFYDFTPNGNRLKVKRNKALVEINGSEYLLSTNQYLICEAIDQFNSLPEQERTYQNNLRSFADIKQISTDAASLLDSYLQSQNVLTPDRIKIDIDYKNGNLEITPLLEIDNQNKFIQFFDLFPGVKEIYPVPSQNGTTRVVVDEKQREGLKKVKSFRRVKDEHLINELVEHPESYFDDDVIDFTVFYSDRVKEIGIYKPRFYPFVCPYKSEWIPGIVIKDKIHGEKRIHIKTEIELLEFESEMNTAQSIGRESFNWNGTEITIPDAEKFIQVAQKQFSNQTKPVTEFYRGANNEVLIIKENAEILEYSENVPFVEQIDHKFFPINNLVSSVTLKQHQFEGIAWLQSLYKNKMNGCLLADDMGLGKTLQLLYFIEWHSQNINGTKPYLVVAPVSLLENWENEYRKFFQPQSLELTLLYGFTNLKKEYNKQDVENMQYKHLILTNYETLRIYQFNICALDYAIVVLDEAQKIKTPGTLITNVSKALKADFKVSMTGTPVENTLVDLWCIMDFSIPGLLGNAKEFAKKYQNPLKSELTDVKELGERLRNRIGVFLKRRLKQDVIKELPRKFDTEGARIKRQMPPAQVERYVQEMELAKEVNTDVSDSRNQMLKSLWAIRDISDHPFLVDSQILSFSSSVLVTSSAKLETLIELLSQIKVKNEKVIVFADRKETQKMLQRVIYDYFGVFPSVINGDTPTTKQSTTKSKLSRQQTIDRFQGEEGFNVIVMSQLAAGVGLNVTEANHVIHYSRHWNPAKEMQATDRVYRIGQQRDVYVYYPMAVFPEGMVDEDGNRIKSFDEVLDALLDRKKNLADSILFPTEQAEVRPDEIFEDVFRFNSKSKSIKIGIQETDKLNPNLFEAFIAALYTKMNFQVFLTPYTNDKGVDVIALGEDKNYLIQAKQSKGSIGINAIQEIFTAKAFYERKFNKSFELQVITNSDFSRSASDMAEANNVLLQGRNELMCHLAVNEISMKDINSMESQRITSI